VSFEGFDFFSLPGNWNDTLEDSGWCHNSSSAYRPLGKVLPGSSGDNWKYIITELLINICV
jgi:hypothetical protein